MAAPRAHKVRIGVLGKYASLRDAYRPEKIGTWPLRAEVDKLAAPPSSYGTILQRHPDDTVDVWTGGRKLKVNVTPDVDPAALRRGREVVLNEALNVVDLSGGDPQGEIVRLKDRLDETRVMVTLRADEERAQLELRGQQARVEGEAAAAEQAGQLAAAIAGAEANFA